MMRRKILLPGSAPADNTMRAIFQIVSIAGKEFSISKAKHWKLQKKMATHFVKLYLTLKSILHAMLKIWLCWNHFFQKLPKGNYCFIQQQLIFTGFFLLVVEMLPHLKRWKRIHFWSFAEKVLTSRPKSFYWWKGWQESACHFMDIGNI